MDERTSHDKWVVEKSPNLQDRVKKKTPKAVFIFLLFFCFIYHVFGSLEDVYSLRYIFLALSFHLVPSIVSVAERVYTACRLRLERWWLLWQKEWQQGCSLMPYAVSNPMLNDSKFCKILPPFLWLNLKIRIFILNVNVLTGPCPACPEDLGEPTRIPPLGGVLKIGPP